MAEFFGSSFCYDRDYEEDRGPSDWDLERSWYYSLNDDEYEGLDESDEPEEFEDRFDPQETLCTPVHRSWDFWESERARSRSKSATLRSWRNPRALGGSQSRKAIVRKMSRRRPRKFLLFVPTLGPSQICLAG